MKFIIDDTLGVLAKRLRFLGFDAQTVSGERAREKLSDEPERVFLSRSQKRARAAGERGFWVRSDHWREQLQQVFEEFSLTVPPGVLSRCSLCNLVLEMVRDKAEIEGRVPDYIYANHEKYYHCPGCGRIYWRGSHWEKLEDFIGEFKEL